MAFPANPIDGEEHRDYFYDAALQAWKKRSHEEHWAIKEGPLSFVASYIVRWNAAYQEGDSCDALSHTDQITILKDGLYEVRAVQRLNIDQAIGYISIAANGDRNTLIARPNSCWTHDDVRMTDYGYTESGFLGWLYAGDVITSGPQSTHYQTLVYNAHSYSGSLLIKRLD